MKRSTISGFSAILGVISIAVLMFQGFGLPNVPLGGDVVLRILAAACVQVFVVSRFKSQLLRAAPLLAAGLIVLWGGFLFITSDAWENASFGGYFADYCTPFLGCCAARLMWRW